MTVKRVYSVGYDDKRERTLRATFTLDSGKVTAKYEDQRAERDFGVRAAARGNRWLTPKDGQEFFDRIDTFAAGQSNRDVVTSDE